MQIVTSKEAAFRGSVSVKRTVAANGIQTIQAVGNFYYLVEADYVLEIKTDVSSFKLHDVGTGERFPDYVDEGITKKVAFGSLEIRNPNNVECEFEIVVGFSEYIDNRLNVVERRNGSAASTVPPILTEYRFEFTGSNENTWQKFLDSNPNRSHVWLADNGSAAYWAGADITGSASETANFRVIPDDGNFVKLDYKGEVWIRGANGAEITALEFTF